jgi:hypothetical protein
MILNADNRTLTIFDFRKRHDSTACIFRLLFRFLVLLLDQDKHCNYLFPSELLWFLILNVLMSLIVNVDRCLEWTRNSTQDHSITAFEQILGVNFCMCQSMTSSGC